MHRIRNPAYRFSCTEGSNPSLSASYQVKTTILGRFCFLPTNSPINNFHLAFGLLFLLSLGFDVHLVDTRPIRFSNRALTKPSSEIKRGSANNAKSSISLYPTVPHPRCVQKYPLHASITITDKQLKIQEILVQRWT